MKKTQTIYYSIVFLILLTAAFVTLIPLIYTFSASFKTNMEIMIDPSHFFPKNPTLENYSLALHSENFRVGRMLFNSTYYSVFNVCVAILISSMSGYVFARGEFRGKNIVFGCFTLLLFVKTGGLEIYPKFGILNALHLNNGLPGLMFLGLFSIPVVNMYLIRGFVQSLPHELDEAAEIDGCGFTKTFFIIILPLLKPILATVGILAFQGSWNDYLMPTIFTFNHPEQQPLIVGLMALKSSSGAATNWNLMLAGTVIALMPVLVAYSIGNKYFVSGLAAGAVKG